MLSSRVIRTGNSLEESRRANDLGGQSIALQPLARSLHYLYGSFHPQMTLFVLVPQSDSHSFVLGPFLAPCVLRGSLIAAQVLTMDGNSQRPKRQNATLSSLNAAIEVVNIAKDVLSATQAAVAFGTVVVILAAIRVGCSPAL